MSGGLKAMFTKEIEEALLEQRIDLAVHSLKDMPAELPSGLEIMVVPEREDPRDVWISKGKIPFEKLAKGATVATSAVRRQAQLRHLRSDLKLVPMQGNVDTRLQKLAGGEWDGMILALAGLKRLKREDVITDILHPDILLPAIGQGALALEARTGDTMVQSQVKVIDHLPSHQAALAERAFLKDLGGSCQTPIAAYARVNSNQISLVGLVVGPSGDPYLRDTLTGPAQQAELLGKQLARRLLAAGARQVLA
jgi:hydroxymethylbilane synthase